MMLQPRPIRVMVTHKHPITRAGLTAGLRQYHDIELVETSSEPGDASALASPVTRPFADVVVTDYEAALALVDQDRSPRPSTGKSRVMIVTPSERELDIRRALARGAHGYMLVDSDFDDLADGVRNIHRGVRALSQRIAEQLLESVAGEQLSARELQVLHLVTEGMGNKLVARRLGIAVGTVKSHTRSIFDKLQVTSRTQAIAVAERRGLLSEARQI